MINFICVSIGAICIILSYIGCVIPAIPGPLLGFISLLCLLPTTNPVGWLSIVFGGAIMVFASVLDYMVPAISAKRFKCSKMGVWGCTIGSILGMFIMPIGLFLGPFLGALVGELISGKLNTSALKGGFGALIGVLIGMLIKMIACSVIAVMFAVAAFKCF